MGANSTDPDVLNQTLLLLFNYSIGYGEVDDEYGTLAAGPQLTLTRADESLQKALQLMHLYYMPVLCMAGILANILASLILSASDLTHLSVTFFLLGKVLVDTLFLVSLLHRWVTETFHVFLYDVGGWCNFIIFLSRTSGFLSLWYTFCFVTDVFIRVYLEGFTAKLCTPWRAKIITIGFAIVAVVVYLNISLTYGVSYFGDIPVCAPLAQFVRTIHNLDRGDVIINVALPYTCMLVLVGMVAVRVVRVAQQPTPASRIGLQELTHHRQQNHNRGRQQGSPHYSERAPLRDPEKLLGPVFLTLTLSYLVLSLPLQCLRVYFALRKMTSPQTAPTDFLWREVLQFVHFTNMSINFFVFLLSFGRFREQGYSLVQQMFHRFRRTGDSGAPEIVDPQTITHHFAQNAKTSARNSWTAV